MNWTGDSSYMLSSAWGDCDAVLCCLLRIGSAVEGSLLPLVGHLSVIHSLFEKET